MDKITLYCIIEKRENVLQKINNCVEYVGLNCFYCNQCWYCQVTKTLQREASKKGIKTFNSDIDWWSIEWYRDKHGENIPILKYHPC